MLEQIVQPVRVESVEDGELAEFEERLHRVAELGGAHVLREQPIERALVDLEQLHLAVGSHGRLTPVGAEQTHLPERLAAAHRPQHADVARLGILVLDLYAAAAHDVEGVWTVPLPEDRLSPGFRDPETDPAGEVGKYVLRQVVERRQRVASAPRLPRATTSRA